MSSMREHWLPTLCLSMLPSSLYAQLPSEHTSYHSTFAATAPQLISSGTSRLQGVSPAEQVGKSAEEYAYLLTMRSA